MVDESSKKPQEAPAAKVAPKVRPKAKPKAPVDPASLIQEKNLVRYQAAPGKMLPVKCGGKFTFVKSDKAYLFDKTKIKHQMQITIAQEIKAGRLKEV